MIRLNRLNLWQPEFQYQHIGFTSPAKALRPNYDSPEISSNWRPDASVFILLAKPCTSVPPLVLKSIMGASKNSLLRSSIAYDCIFWQSVFDTRTEMSC